MPVDGVAGSPVMRRWSTLISVRVAPDLVDGYASVITWEVGASPNYSGRGGSENLRADLIDRVILRW